MADETRGLREAVLEDDDFYCSQCEDTGWIPCGHCDDGETDPFCGDDLCFGGDCITGKCSPRECRTCSGDGGRECNCEEGEQP